MCDSKFAIFERDVEQNEEDIDTIVCEMLENNSLNKEEEGIINITDKIKTLIHMFHVVKKERDDAREIMIENQKLTTELMKERDELYIKWMTSIPQGQRVGLVERIKTEDMSSAIEIRRLEEALEYACKQSETRNIHTSKVLFG